MSPQARRSERPHLTLLEPALVLEEFAEDRALMSGPVQWGGALRRDGHRGAQGHGGAPNAVD
jgi:hypothetical protein